MRTVRKAFKLFLISLLCFVIFSCAFATPFNVKNESNDHVAFWTNIVIDDKLDDRDQYLTKLALTEWDYALGGTIDISYFVGNIDSNSINCVRLINNESEAPRKWRTGNNDFFYLGFVENLCVNLIRDNIERFAYKMMISYERAFKTVTLHEFGHYLGLRHTSNSNDLMYSKMSDQSPQCVTQLDAWAACTIFLHENTENIPCRSTCGIFSLK